MAFSVVSRFGLPLILLLGLAARLAVGLLLAGSTPLSDYPDQLEYLETARHLQAEGAAYFVDPRFDEAVHAFRMPGYPLWVAAFNADVQAVRIAQAVLDTLTALAIYLLACRLTARPTALLAALFVAFNPWLIYFCSFILSETLTIALLCWGMLGLAYGRWRAWLGVAGLLASLYVRPGSGLLIPLLVVAAYWMNSRSTLAYHWKALAWRGAIAAVAVVLALVPWAWRNAHHPHIGRAVWSITNVGFTAYDGLGPHATGASDQRFVAQMPELQTMDEVERSDYLARLARHWAADHPWQVLRLAVIKAGRTWSPIPLSDTGMKVKLAAGLYSVPFLLLVVVGLWRSRLSRSEKLFLLLPALYLTAVHALTVGSARYRLPAEPPMALLAAAALTTRGRSRSSD